MLLARTHGMQGSGHADRQTVVSLLIAGHTYRLVSLLIAGQ